MNTLLTDRRVSPRKTFLSIIFAASLGVASFGTLTDAHATALNTQTPSAYRSTGDTVVAITAGSSHALYLTNQGKVYAWGYNGFGQLGIGSTAENHVPLLVRGLPTHIVSVSAGSYHSLALTKDGKVYAWGYNDRGQLGNGTTTSSSIPLLVSGLPAADPITAVAGGGSYSAALTKSGKVYMWGADQYEERFTYEKKKLPDLTPKLVRDLPQNDPVIHMALSKGGYPHTTVLTRGGKLYTWGDNRYGELGNGTTKDSIIPVLVQTGAMVLPDDDKLQAISNGAEGAVVLTKNGRVFTWGSSSYGLLGIGNSYDNATSPVAVLHLPDIIRTIMSTGLHTFAITDKGKLYAWGENDNGALAMPGISNTRFPLPVQGLPVNDPIVAVAGGSTFTIALAKSGKIYSWGYNSSGQLGNNTTTNSKLPVTVLPGTV